DDLGVVWRSFPRLSRGTRLSYSGAHMAVVISLLRAVNVGGRNVVRMEALRTICESLGFRNVRTWLQSGNVVFTTHERDLKATAAMLGLAIEQELGVRTDVINRTVQEISGVIDRNPFAARKDWITSKMLVTFLADDPGEQTRQQVREIPV